MYIKGDSHMNVLQKIINWLKKRKLNNVDKKEPKFILYPVVDYQESNLENYLSGCCINNIY